MTPEEARADLDEFTHHYGEDVVLRRTTGSQLVPLEVTVRACVPDYRTEALVEGATRDAIAVILSPTEMQARQWCWPPIVGDFAIVKGQVGRVAGVLPRHIGDELVRLELAVA